MNKAHIQHAVSFIQHQDFNLIQFHRILVLQIEQTTRSSDQHIYAATQLHHLRVNADAAEDHQRANIQILTVITDVFANLGRQFAGWREDQRTNRTTAFTMRLIGDQVLQQRQGKTCRFPRTGLGAGHQIAAFQHGRNSLLLNRGRFTVTLLGNGT